MKTIYCISLQLLVKYGRNIGEKWWIIGFAALLLTFCDVFRLHSVHPCAECWSFPTARAI